VRQGSPIEEAKQTIASLYLMNPNKPQCHEVIPVRLMEISLINEAYERTQKEVKQELKKDFSAVDVATGIANLQRLVDEGKMKLNPHTIDRLALVLGCFLTDELDGVEWVSVIDGRNEYPALSMNGQVVNPTERLATYITRQGKCDLREVYEELMK